MNFLDENLTSEQRARAFEAMPPEEQRVALEVLKHKNQAAKEKPSIPSLGQVMHQVISEPTYFRPGVEEIDYRNRNLPYSQRLAAFNQRNVQQQNQANSKKTVKCPYCLDRRYVVISPEWLMDDIEIPEDFDPSKFAAGYSPGSSFPGSSFPGSATENDKKAMVACDCHPGHIGPDGYQQSVCRFSDYFLEHISTSVYGERIREYRQQRAKERERKAV